MTFPSLTIVVPVRDRASQLVPLAESCLQAARAISPQSDVLFVDDASDDDTPTTLYGLHQAGAIRSLRLMTPQGPLRAAQAGIRQSPSEWIAVLRPDQGDDPQLLVAMAEQLHVHPHCDAVFACRARASIADGAYRMLALLARTPLPAGAQNCCVLTRAAALKISNAHVPNTDLIAIGAALELEICTLPGPPAMSDVSANTSLASSTVALALIGALSKATAVAALPAGAAGLWLLESHTLAAAIVLFTGGMLLLAALQIELSGRRALTRARRTRTG